MVVVGEVTMDEMVQRIVARRRECVSLQAIAAEFDVSVRTIGRILGRTLTDEERRQIEHETRMQAQAKLADDLRAELLKDLPPCGCPQCEDPECTVPLGFCHHCRVEPVAKAPQTHAAERTVIGYPLMYHSRACRGHATKGDLRDTARQILKKSGVGPSLSTIMEAENA